MAVPEPPRGASAASGGGAVGGAAGGASSVSQNFAHGQLSRICYELVCSTCHSHRAEIYFNGFTTTVMRR